MMQGVVPYRDLFEQKGPLLYFIHGLASLISYNSFLGVFIFEVLSFSVVLFFAQRTLALFSLERVTFWMLPILAFTILISNSFYKGDSAEEFCMPLLSASLYLLIRYFKNSHRGPMSYADLVISGVLAGCVLWIKYTMLGFWFAWMMMVFFDMIRQKRYGRAIGSCFVFLAGMLSTAVPWILYFAINHALYDWIYAYFIVNIFGYSHPMGMPSRLLFILLVLCMEFVKNIWFALPALVGILAFICSSRYLHDWMAKCSVPICFLFLLAGMYGGGSAYPYYFLILSPFATLGLLFLFDILCEKIRKAWMGNLPIAGALTVVLLGSCFFLNKNVEDLFTPQKDLVQYQFAEIIRQTPNATMLNYGFLDGGFYTAAEIMPQTKYFCKLNITVDRFPEMMQEQNRYLKEKLVDYVVVEWAEDKERSQFKLDFLRDNYEVVCEQVGTFDGQGRKYILYKAKE